MNLRKPICGYSCKYLSLAHLLVISQNPYFFFIKIFCDPIPVFSCPSSYLEDNTPPHPHHYQRWWRSKVESTEANLHPFSYIITIFCSYGRTAPQTKIEHVLYDISKLSIVISKINESISWVKLFEKVKMALIFCNLNAKRCVSYWSKQNFYTVRFYQ